MTVQSIFLKAPVHFEVYQVDIECMSLCLNLILLCRSVTCWCGKGYKDTSGAERYCVLTYAAVEYYYQIKANG